MVVLKLLLLWLLLLAPLLVALYVWLLGRSRATVYPNLAIIRSAQTAGSRLRRHVPPLLMLLALVVLVVDPVRRFLGSRWVGSARAERPTGAA